jgi:hypothetical protein
MKQHTDLKEIFDQDEQTIQDDKQEFQNVEDDYIEHGRHNVSKDHSEHRGHEEQTLFEQLYEYKWFILILVIALVCMYIYMNPPLRNKVEKFLYPKQETPQYIETKLEKLEL